MRQRRHIVAAAVAAITSTASACADSERSAVRVMPLEPALLVAGGHSATGGGHIDLTSAGAGFDQFSFSAVGTPGGKANGRFHQVFELGGLAVDFHGEVTCVSVDAENRRAWVGGVVTQNNSTHPAFTTSIHEPGDDVWFRVVDYGEGGNASQRDRSTIFGFEGAAGIITSAEYCATQPWPDADARTFPVGNGNIQVRP